MKIQEYLNFLGLEVKDCVTGMKGIVSSVSFDLYGCVQAIVVPPVKEGTIPDSFWFDINRLEIINKKPVMRVPSFDAESIEMLDGPADKPSFKK